VNKEKCRSEWEFAVGLQCVFAGFYSGFARVFVRFSEAIEGVPILLAAEI